ncbi:hypothetical protein AB6C80_023445 [Vibrio cyclitrophicus]
MKLTKVFFLAITLAVAPLLHAASASDIPNEAELKNKFQIP